MLLKMNWQNREILVAVSFNPMLCSCSQTCSSVKRTIACSYFCFIPLLLVEPLSDQEVQSAMGLLNKANLLSMSLVDMLSGPSHHVCGQGSHITAARFALSMPAH